MGLTDDELRDVLARAQEIDGAARDGDEWKAELAAVIEAAEEVGLSRQAVERALAEGHYLPTAPPVVGSLTWARSADGKFYVADVLATSEVSTHVRFLRGSEQHLALRELRPCAFSPGELVVCDWPGWGAWTCRVVAYDSDKRKVELSDRWGSTSTFPISDVWQAPPKSDSRVARRRTYALLAAGAAAGALIGSIITALLM